MTLLYLVRHGQTDWNLERRIQGSTDIPLNATGRAQAARTGELLARRRWDAIASSPLARALETGRIIGERVGIGEIEIVDELAERAYGEAEGLDARELERRFPGSAAVPGRESREGVLERVIPALVALGERHAGRSVIVTTHGGVIRTVVTAVAPDALEHQGVPISNGSVHSFRLVDGALQLLRFDDPIEFEAGSGEDIEEQNPLEQRSS